MLPCQELPGNKFDVPNNSPVVLKRDEGKETAGLKEVIESSTRVPWIDSVHAFNMQ